MILVVAEVGSNFSPQDYPLEDAIKSALDCGADLVKLQFFEHAWRLAFRRNPETEEVLQTWRLEPKQLVELAHKFPGVVGFSVFHDIDVTRVESETKYARPKVPLAFVKTATQEFGCALLARKVSAMAQHLDIPLFVSVPRDGCLTVGNYEASQAITWLYCEPFYPAQFDQYKLGQVASHVSRIAEMQARLPGRFGLSDHTTNEQLARFAISRHPDLYCIEKHFCYHEGLRGQTPDSGPWALGVPEFKKFAEVVHGVS
jgi:sialic acid synthase SpsE